MKDQITVYYDDQIDRVVDKINELLSAHGLVLADDGEEHDGYCVYRLHMLLVPL